MTKEDKELLLKDLCARFPYGVKYNYGGNDGCDYELDTINRLSVDDAFPIEDIKPYLRRMSSMSEEEVKDFAALESIDVLGGDIKITCVELSVDAIDWLNAHHFDYRGLIEKGLALEAPEGMYKTE